MMFGNQIIDTIASFETVPGVRVKAIKLTPAQAKRLQDEIPWRWPLDPSRRANKFMGATIIVIDENGNHVDWPERRPPHCSPLAPISHWHMM